MDSPLITAMSPSRYYSLNKEYSNPYGNLTVIDNADVDMLPYISTHWYGFAPLNVMWYGLVSFFVGICLIFAVSGNVIVMYIFTCSRELRTPSNFFVVNLALSDFLLMFCMGPPLFVNSYFQKWYWGPIFCQIYGAIGSVTGCSAIFTMCLISYDRYCVIVKGLSAKPLTPCSAMMQIIGSWVVSLAWTCAPFFGWGRYAPEGNMTACGTDYLSQSWNHMSYVFAYSLWCYFFPLFFICYCYWYIVGSVFAHERQMKEQAKKMGVKSLRQDSENKKRSSEYKLAKIALVTVSLWFMAWTPYLVINFAGLFYRQIVSPLFSIWGSVFAKANSVYNPIVYAISHPKYKTVLYKKIPCLSCKSDDTADEDSSTASTVTTQEERK